MSFWPRPGKLLKIRLEFSQGKSNKFYLMEEQPDGGFMIRYGRIGTHGTVLSYTAYEAEQKYDEKLKKGYSEKSNSYTSGKAMPASVVEKIKQLLASAKTKRYFPQRRYGELQQFHKRANEGEILSADDFGQLNYMATELAECD